MKNIVLPAKMEHLAQLVGFIKKAVEDHGGNRKDIYQVHLLSEEIILNIIKYAYPEKTGDIEISHTLSREKELTITISDSGIPFNPLEKETPDISLSLDDRSIGGLGIFMVRKVVDDLIYERKDNKNYLKIIKKLSC